MTQKQIKALVMWNEPITDMLVMVMSKRFNAESMVKVSNPKDLLRIIQRHHPKLLIIDTAYPSCNCDEIIARIKQDPQNLNLYIISIMKHKSEEQKKKFLLLGSNAIYHSPIDLHDLFSSTANILGLSYRKNPRYPVLVELNISLNNNGKLLTGISSNISKSGMLLGLDERIIPNKKIKITFDPKDDNGVLTLNSKVVRTSNQEGKWWHGINFLDISSDVQYRLERFIINNQHIVKQQLSTKT